MSIVIGIVPWQAFAEELGTSFEDVSESTPAKKPGPASLEASEPASAEVSGSASAETSGTTSLEASETASLGAGPASAEASYTAFPDVTEPALTAEQSNNKVFNDVNPNDWFYDAVIYVFKNNIFSGTGNNNFSPYAPMTRAMFVTVLGRIAGIGSDYPIQEGLFSDVKSDAYYAPYVMWAAEKGIARGIGNSRFDPDSLVTREQMAVFTVRFFDAYGIPYPESTPKKAPADFDHIADYARDAVMKLWNSGLLVGDEQGNFNPGDNAIRAEAATFARRIYNTVSSFWESTQEQDQNTEANPDSDTDSDTDSNTGSEPGWSAEYYSIKFITNGGGNIETQWRPKGSMLRNLPIPYKGNEIFDGWYYDKNLENRVLESDVITRNLTLYAKYSAAAPLVEEETPAFASAVDQESGFTITVVSSELMTAEQVKSAITAKNISSPDQTNFIEVTGDGITFEIRGAGGFEAGATYKLTLEDERLCFQGFGSSVRNFYFTIAKEDVMNLTLSRNMIYIPASEINSLTENSRSVKSLSTPLVRMSGGTSMNLSGLVEGTFTYGGSLDVGDTVCIYEGIRPDERVLDDTRPSADGEIAYLAITAVNGNTYSYKCADIEDVLFKPDVLPVPNTADTDRDPDNNSVTVEETVMEFSDDKYDPMQLDSQTTVDEGDYLAFYDGEFGVDAVVTGYGCITSVRRENGVMIITYTSVTLDQMMAAMDIYNAEQINGEDIL